MSSLWSSMKKRRSSLSSPNLRERESGGDSKPGSERHPGPREEAFTDRVTRLAEQVLPRSGFRSIRLPPALSKGFATGSLPRHFSTRSVEAQSTPGSTDSKPTRAPLMGLSPDRFTAPIKNILMRPRRGKPPMPPERVPLKPTRRPGPVGKSWIKVYDDIIYIDDTSGDDIVPFLGYTGHPTMVPDAEPLPMAPTPPPEKLKMEFIENTPPRPKRAPGRSPKNRSTPGEDKENLSPNATEEPRPPPSSGRASRSREISRYKAKRQKRAGTPLGRDVNATSPGGDEEAPLPATDDNEEVMEDGYIIPQSLKPPKPPRGNKIYETINKPFRQPHGDREPQREPSPAPTPRPDKPKRGIKIYESIVIKVKDEGNRSVEGESKAATEETSSPLNRPHEDDNKGSTDVPFKPKRGVKIYETIEIGFRVISGEGKPQSSIVKEGEEVKQDEGSISSSVTPEGGGVKQDGAKDTAETPYTRENEAEEQCPSKPLRGNKIYATVNLSQPLKSTPTLKGPTDPPFLGGDKGMGEVKGENEIYTSVKCVDTPVYAKIHRTSQATDLNEESGFPLREIPDSSFPPPVPPKKRKQLRPPEYADENIYDVLPSRPPRRLKSRPRSCEASPLRPKRHKPLTPPKAHRSCNTGTQNVKGVRIWSKDRSSTLPLPRSKANMMDSSSCEDLKDSQESSFPSKPFRNVHSRLLPAPPRRKKLNKSFEEDQIPLSFQDDTLPIPKSQKQVPISKVHEDFLVMESRPPEKTLTMDVKVADDLTPPPPPPKKGKIAATKISETKESFPSNLREENGRTDTTETSESESTLVKITELSGSSETRVGGRDAEDFSSVQLDADIENNLKAIESSFETLDTVIQCLKKYAPQGALNETDKTVPSDKDQIDKTIEPADCGRLLTTTDVLSTSKTQELRTKEPTSVVTESEISDISVANSDAETVIFVGKSSSQDSLNFVDNILSSPDLEDKKGSTPIPPSLLVEEDPGNLAEDNDGAEPKPIEISFVIKRDQPVTLPLNDDFVNKAVNRQKDSNAQIVVTEIPLKIKSTEKTEFKFEPPKGDIEAKLIPASTEIPLKTSTTEDSKSKTSLQTLSGAEPAPAFQSFSGVYLLPLTPVSLEGQARLSEPRKCLLEDEVRKPSPESPPSDFQQTPSHATTPTNLLYFRPSSLRSEKLESDLPEQFYPSSSNPSACKVGHKSETYFTSSTQVAATSKHPSDTKLEVIHPSPSARDAGAHKHFSESKPKDTLPPREIQSAGSSSPFNSLSPINLTPFLPKLLEGRKEPSERQQKYRLEPTPETTPFLNLEYLEHLKTIPFYDFPPTDIPPFSPKSLVSEEKLEDSLTPKVSTPNPEHTPLTPLNQASAVHSGTFELASRLEGIHSQLEAIITNYPTSSSSSYASLDSALSDVSNQSSCFDFPSETRDSPLSFSSFYSPTPELDHRSYSLCSTPLTFYTAATPSERSNLSDSGTNTPGSSSNSSLKADDDHEYTIEHDVEGETSPVEEEAQQQEF